MPLINLQVSPQISRFFYLDLQVFWSLGLRGLQEGLFFSETYIKWKHYIRGCLHEKTCTGTRFIPTWLFDFVSRLQDDWVIHISFFEGTLHVDKMHVWFKIANITHALPVPVYRQTDFTPKRVVVSCLYDTVARFCTGVKFLPRCDNRSELTPGRLAPAWLFVVVSCKQM